MGIEMEMWRVVKIKLFGEYDLRGVGPEHESYTKEVKCQEKMRIIQGV